MSAIETARSDEPIFGRISGAIARAKARDQPKAILLGQREWNALSFLAYSWDHDWPPGGSAYRPIYDESKRAKMNDIPIYRVDAENFLAVI